jgi:hypothetical protein
VAEWAAVGSVAAAAVSVAAVLLGDGDDESFSPPSSFVDAIVASEARISCRDFACD